MMSSSRRLMENELKSEVEPMLRANGFRGSFPHYRRPGKDGIALLTFQFDKRGGGFIIEIAHAPMDGITTHWGAVIEPQKVKAWNIHPNERKRIKPGEGSGTDSWFRYDEGQFRECSRQVLAALPDAEAWWVVATSRSVK